MEHLFNSVLLVDNMPDVLAVTQLFFQVSGFEVHTAHSAKEAIELYKVLQRAHRTPDVFIADGALGAGDDGFTLLSKIKDLDRQRLTTTFIYTAYGVDRAKLLAIGSGAESIIDKMKVGDNLLEEINAGVRNRQQRQAQTMRAPGQLGGSWFSDKELMFACVVVIWMLFTAVEMTLQYNQKTQILKNQEDIISNQKLQILRIDDTREDIASYGMLNKNGPYGRKEEKK